MKTKRFILLVASLFSLVFVLTSCFQAERNKYDITFETNGGSVVESQTVEHDRTLTRPENPTKEGHTFVDWYIDEEFTTVYDFNKKVRSSFTLYADWEVNKYNISYATNIEGYTIKGKVLEYGEALEAPVVDEKIFKVEGNHFAGWYLDQTYETKLNENTTVPAYDVTLYAKWEKNDYKLTFINDDLTYKVFDVKYGDSIPTVENPTKVGHTFAGWLLNKTDLECVSPDYKITNNVTLYAKWTKNKYVVTFDSNGGSAVESVEYNYFDQLVAPTAPTKTGYTFAGWYLDGVYYNLNDNKMPANDITLVAAWTINSYTVTFDSNGGSDVLDSKVVFGTKVTEPTAPTKIGYTFVGWYLDGTLYDFDSLMPANGITLVAEWAINEYTINFDLNGATGTIQSINTKYNEIVKAPECVDRLGYTFVNWNTKADGTGKGYKELADLTNISTGDDITLYAIWTLNEYTLTVTLSQTEVYTYTFNYGDSIEEVINAINTEKEDAEFAGWFAFVNDTWVEFIVENATMPNNDFAITAKYLGEVTITFVSNGQPINSFIGYESEEITDEILNPTREGYTFGGWYLDDKYQNEYNLTVYPTENIYVYAKWTVNTITITFDGNGSTSGSMNSLSVVYDSNTALTLNAFERIGYKFLGWSTNKDATEIEFVDGYNKNVASEGEVTLYAVWQVNTYTITFNSNGGSNVNKIEQPYGSEVLAPEAPTKTGYTFAGWFLNGEEYTFSTITNTNITLVAKWTANKYTLTINTTIDGIAQDVKTFDIYYDVQVLTYDAITKYALEGYSFNGWYEDDGFTVKAVFNDATLVEGNIELYATYTIQTYTVNFISNGEIIYSTTKKYKEEVSFNEYIEVKKLYAQAYKNLADAITAVVASASNAPLLLNCINTNLAYYYNNEALMTYIGILSSGASLSQSQWQEFYGVSIGLYEGEQAIVNIYEDNKIGDNYVPNRQGHFFGGWYLGADSILDNKVGVPFTNITPASTIGLSTVNIVANWQKLNSVVELNAKDDVINTIEWTQIETDQIELESDETYTVQYLIYSIDGSGNLNLLDVVSGDPSVKTLEYIFMTKDTFSAPGNYDLVIIANLKIYDTNTNEVIKNYESDVNESTVLKDFKVVLDPDNVNVSSSGDYYSVAGDTFYFFTNMEYTFNAAGTFELVNPDDSKYATLTGNKIITNNIATYTYFEFTNTTSSDVKTYKAYVLPYVSQFTLGKGLSNFIDSNSKNSSFYGKNATYTIGRYFEDEALGKLATLFEYKDNGYKFDLNILTNGGKVINTLEFGNYLVYEFYDAEGQLLENVGTYDSETGAWSFDAPVGDYSVQISINDLYVAPYQLEHELIKPITFNFSLDNSVNVYNNEQFKAVYNNTTIGEELYNNGRVVRGISMHENIEAELTNEQYYDYWKENNVNPSITPQADKRINVEEALKTHSPINIDNSITLKVYDQPNYSNGHAYERISRVELYETFNINGNCFTIDGSNLPRVSIYSRGNQSKVSGYLVPYNSVAILSYVISENYSTSQSKLVLNDLHIVGNSTKPVLDESSENFQTSIQLMNTNAAGYIAVNVGYGVKLESNNSFITRSTIAFDINRNCSLDMVDSKIVDCWFNGIYGYANSDITITNSYLKDFGGAIIHVEDLDSTVKVDGAGNVISEYGSSAKITVDANSVLENYVSGDEGFFKAYSLEILIMQLKAGFEANVNKKNWTMIKKVKDPVTGLEYEKVNLMMLLVAKNDNAEGAWVDEANGIKGAGRNMMNLGFTGATTEGLKGINQAMGTNFTHLNSTMMINYLGGSDLLVKKTNMSYSQAGYLEEGILLNYQPTLPGFGGSIIVTGVNGRPNQ